MTNFEDQKDRILEIVNQGRNFAVSNGKVKECSEIECEECDLLTDLHACTASKIKWIYEEAAPAPAPTLTKEERAFCSFIKNGYIARDSDEYLYVYTGKPTKGGAVWKSCEGYLCIDSACFPFIKWEDKRPWSIEELLKLEVEDESI